MELEQITSMIESILFVSDKPVSAERLREVIGVETTTEQDIKDALDSIKERYESPRHGYELREGHGGFHFGTKAQNAEIIRKFLQMKPFRLGRSALEVLSIIAYRQPITRAEIDKVRGIDSSHLMRTLMERGLVRMDGKADVPGRPVQYGTTPRFLEVTGLRSLGELPPLSELEQLQGHTPEDPMRRMEEGLDKILAESKTRAEVAATGEDTEGLDSIEAMINSVHKPDREIYESELHADVARENEAALEGFLNHMRPFRKSRKQAAVESTDAEASVAVDIAVEGTDGEAPVVEQAAVPESEVLPETVPSPEAPTELLEQPLDN